MATVKQIVPGEMEEVRKRLTFSKVDLALIAFIRMRNAK